MTLDELSKVGLIGTSRSKWSLPPAVDASLEQAFAIARSASVEEQLLTAAAMISAYESCGRTSVSIDAPSSPSPADAMQECSVRAGELLNQILSLSNTPTKLKLLLEWLMAAGRAKRRVPHLHLAPLLDYTAGNRRVREAATAVIDHRGIWLMSLNPKWQFAGSQEIDAATIFTTGQRDQRLAAIRRMRETDANQARELIKSTWAEDAADDRAVFVGAMGIALNADDEPFLESALDDRSKQVRAVAADLLACIEGSAYVRRMIERVEPLLTFTPGAAGGLLKRATPPKVEAQLPPDSFDTTWVRDGVIEKPTDRTGRRQWWFAQMLRTVPPSHWSTKWRLTPDQCFEAATGDFADLLISTWSDAAELHRDTAWMRAAVLRSADASSKVIRVSIIPHLPPADQSAVLMKVFTSRRADANVLQQVLSELSAPFDVQLSDAAIAAVERTRQGKSSAYDYTLPGLLDPLSHLIHPSKIDDLATRWTGDAWESNRKTLDGFFNTLQVRRSIQTEFRS